MKFATSNEKIAIQKFTDLEASIEREAGISFDKLICNTADPKTRTIINQSKRIREFIKNYNDASSSGIPKLRRTFGRSGIPSEARRLIEEIEELHDFFVSTTVQRGAQRLLSPLAFHPRLETIEELKTAHSFSGTWVLDFKQRTNAPSNISIRGYGDDAITRAVSSILEKFGLSHSALCAWWRTEHLDNDNEATVIWNDMRALSRKLIYMLDRVNARDDVSDSDCTTLSACVKQAMETAISFIRLVDRYPDEVEKLRPCMELFVPTIFALSECTKDPEYPNSCLAETLDVLECVIERLASLVDHLGGKILANKITNALEDGNAEITNTLAEYPISEQGRSVVSGLVPDASELSKSLQRTDDHIESCARKIVAKRRQKTNGHSLYSIQDLKRLGLRQIQLEEHPCGRLGSGSYGLVRKYNSLDGSKQYAVKTFRREDIRFNEERIWNHVIREAEIWSVVKHRNINNLVGFCTFRNEIYPGLVMDVCKENLREYCAMQPRNLEDKLNLMLDVVSGLNHLHTHENHYAHGDLRPENILIRCPRSALQTFAVITDFGVADTSKDIFTRISFSTDGQRAPEEYLAPEFCTELTDSIARVSAEADMYAFACVFAEIVCEKILYKDSKRNLRKMKQRGEYPVSVDGITDMEFALLLRNLWSKSPDQRWKASSVALKVKEFIISSRTRQ